MDHIFIYDVHIYDVHMKQFCKGILDVRKFIPSYPFLSKLKHTSIHFIQKSMKMTCKQLTAFRKIHVCVKVIPGNLGCLANFKITQEKFLLRQPAFPDNLSVSCDLSKIPTFNCNLKKKLLLLFSVPFCLLNLYMFWLASLWIFGLHNDNLFFSFLFFLTHDTFANLQTEKKLRRLGKY